MKKMLIALFLFAVTPLAYAFPTGCYVTFDNPSVCYPFQLTVADCYANHNDNIYYYGYAMGSMCNSGDDNAAIANQNKTLYDACSIDFNNMVDERDHYWNGWNQCYADFNNLNTASTSNVAKKNSLIKKLKKACGARCKNIK